MFKLDNEAALLAAFRPKDQKGLELTAGQPFPIIVRGYFAWTHPAGGRVYLVFAVPGGVPTGIAFETNGGAGPAVPHMCDWCHSSGTGTEMGLLTARVNSKKRVGVHLCTDLSCRRKLEEAADLQGISAEPAMEKLISRMGRFAQEALKIDLSGTGRP